MADPSPPPVRKIATRACLPCRRLHGKCDSVEPSCGPCVRRGNVDCVYVKSRRGGKRQPAEPPRDQQPIFFVKKQSFDQENEENEIASMVGSSVSTSTTQSLDSHGKQHSFVLPPEGHSTAEKLTPRMKLRNAMAIPPQSEIRDKQSNLVIDSDLVIYYYDHIQPFLPILFSTRDATLANMHIWPEISSALRFLYSNEEIGEDADLYAENIINELSNSLYKQNAPADIVTLQTTFIYLLAAQLKFLTPLNVFLRKNIMELLNVPSELIFSPRVAMISPEDLQVTLTLIILEAFTLDTINVYFYRVEPSLPNSLLSDYPAFDFPYRSCRLQQDVALTCRRAIELCLREQVSKSELHKLDSLLMQCRDQLQNPNSLHPPLINPSGEIDYGVLHSNLILNNCILFTYQPLSKLRESGIPELNAFGVVKGMNVQPVLTELEKTQNMRKCVEAAYNISHIVASLEFRITHNSVLCSSIAAFMMLLRYCVIISNQEPLGHGFPSELELTHLQISNLIQYINFLRGYSRMADITFEILLSTLMATVPVDVYHALVLPILPQAV
ncbi:hypothetical protein CANCADRAFT_30246 [Tortispora caseinolytica NRRL Y-17796]|uniref:Zn(2)-C6 fungal-type domain-containing protein n=1 Tax=Tortispora caseinolytica NRRL Y-17796 TaxID=767744 RepID=A0A1E4TJN1_9ASCO|nr:hypothetical protein CANCADRAFT_30246 [Tortispora caseinolytica NRRL Y-17796]